MANWWRRNNLLLLLCLAAPAALADHPLITEDTGVLGKGRWQLELHGEQARDQGRRRTEGSVVLGYGIADKADLQLELPYVRHEGAGDLSLALKWRFYEREPFSVVVKPVVSRDRWGSALAAAYELRDFELIGHVGYLRNRVDGERESLWHTSVALLWSATKKLKLVLDMGRDTNPDRSSAASIRELVLGATYALTEDIDLGFGVKWGRSEPADDRTALLGIKLRW